MAHVKPISEKSPLVLLDPDFNFLRVNEAYARACRREAQELIGRNIFELYPSAEIEATFRRVMENKSPYMALARAFAFPDHPEWGAAYWDWSLAPVLNESGEVDFLVLSLNDATERKRAELEGERQNAIMEGSNRIFREALTSETLEDLGLACLNVAEELTGSRLGFIDLVNEDGSLDLLAVGGAGLKACRQIGKKGSKLPSHVPVRGIYRSVIESGTPLIANDPASHPDWWGLPQGHPALASFMAVPLKHGRKTIGLMGLGNREGGYRPQELETGEALAIPIANAIWGKQAAEALRKSEENLHILAGHLMEAQETERRRLHQRLHEGLGQSLLVLKFRMSSIIADQSLIRQEVHQEVLQVLQYIDDLINEVRHLSHDLNPVLVDDLGLTWALKYLFDEFRTHYKILSHFIKIDDVDGIYELNVESNIYRIFQEILTNIGKHAEATRISVIVKRQNNRVSFSVWDNGRGFSVSEALARQSAERGIGLVSMQERIRLVGGMMDIWSRKGAGTKITFTVPIRLKQ